MIPAHSHSIRTRRRRVGGTGSLKRPLETVREVCLLGSVAPSPAWPEADRGRLDWFGRRYRIIGRQAGLRGEEPRQYLHVVPLGG